MNDVINYASKIIFLIDDEPDILDITEQIINIHLTAKVYKFSHPTLALEKLDEGLFPNLFVTDIRMPQMNGLSFCEKIKERKINTPIIIASGYAEKEDAIKCLELGVLYLLDKPFEIEIFLHAIKRALIFEELSAISNELSKEKGQLIKCLQNYIQNNEERMRNAENIVFEHKHSMLTDKKQIKEILQRIRDSTSLDKDINKAYENIDKLIKRQNLIFK